MSGWLTALRIARREARRAPGRSALVVALIGLPVVALTFVAVAYDSFRLTAEQEIDRDLGTADAQLTWRYDGPAYQTPDLRSAGADPDVARRESAPTAAEVRDVLPPGSRVVPRRGGTIEMRTAGGHGELRAEWLDLDDPIHRDRVVLRDGRAPAGAGTVALTHRAADRLGASLGDPVATADGEQSWTVVGIAEFPFRFQEAMLLPAEELSADEPVRAETWLVTTPEPVTWDQVRDLNQHGILVTSRHALLHPPPPSQVDADDHAIRSPDDTGQMIAVGTLLVGLALLEVVLLAGPAFAVSARRRQRELGLVAASGGTPAHQRRIVLADGLVLGAAGAAVGIAVGVAAALGMMLLLEEQLMGRRAGGTRVFPLALVGAAGLAVFTGLVAALVPAATAARQHVVTALSGRRGQVRSRRRWLVLGLVTASLGAAVAAGGAWQVHTGMVLTGLIVGQLGLVLCTPALVGLVARLGRFLPLTPRIALRDTARNRAAAAPAISAVMAAVSGALALGVYLTADDERSRDSYQAGLPVGNAAVTYEVWGDDGPEMLSTGQRERARAALQATLPAGQVQEVAAPVCAPDAGADHCYVRVPVPEQRRCPAEILVEDRLESGGSREAVLSEQEQRQARADPRCQEPQLGWQVYLGHAFVDDGTALPALIGGDDQELATASRMLDRGGAVVTDERKVVDGHATLEVVHRDGERERTHEVTIPAYAFTSGENVPFVVLSPGALAATGLAADPHALVTAASAVPTRAQQDALREGLAAIHPELRAQVETGRARSEDPALLVLAVIAGVVALAAAGIATGLVAADRRGDLATLGAVGASARVRRLLSTSQSGVVAGLGALLGTVAGLGSATAVLVALNRAEAQVWPVTRLPYELVVPWPQLVLLLVVVPAVAMLGAGLLTRSRLPIERRSA